MKLIQKLSLITICLTVFLVPFYFLRFKILGLPTNILEISILATVLLVIADLKINQTKIKFLPIWSYLLILSTAVGYFLADDKMAALGIIKGWFVLPFLLGWAVYNKLKKADFVLIAWPIVFSGFVVAIWAILQKTGLITTLFYQSNDPSFNQYLLTNNFRVFGPFESPNYLAMFLVPMMFLALPMLLSRNWLVKSLTAITWVLEIVALYFSGSRAGLIALFLAPLIFLATSGSVKTMKSLFLKTTLIIVSFLALAITILNVEFNPGGDSIRLEIYKYSLILLKDHWLLGIGLGNFQNQIAIVAREVESFRIFALPYALHPHNIYLAIWLYFGLSGIICFIALLVDFFLRLRKRYQANIWTGASVLTILSILIHGLFDTTYLKNDLAVIFWLAFSLGLILVNKPLDKNKKDEGWPWLKN